MSVTALEKSASGQSEGGAFAAETCITTHPLGRIVGIEKAAEMSLDSMYGSLTGGERFTQEVRAYLLQLPREDRLIAEAVYSRHAHEFPVS